MTKSSVDESDPPVLRLSAPAKLNLYLEVLSRSPDGYHALETVFQTLRLSDTVSFRPAVDPDRTRLACNDPALSTGPDNLAFQAQLAYRRLRPATPAYDLEITKRIPAGGGLGGGSSDAAAVIRGLRRLHPPGPNDDELRALALELGADVPFFLLGGSAHATGRGEVLTPLPDLDAQAPVHLIYPPFGSATPACFAALTEPERGPRPLLGVEAWLTRWHADRTGALSNRLIPAAARVEPRLAPYLDLLAATRAPAAMTGSGSTLFFLGDPPPTELPHTALTTEFRRRVDLDEA